MKHLFVPYSLALLAKEKGFDEPCFGIYSDANRRLIVEDQWLNSTNNDTMSESTIGCTAPLYQQLVDWFREEHFIIASAIYDPQLKKWVQIVIDGYKDPDAGMEELPMSETYYQALTAALTEAFKLI